MRVEINRNAINQALSELDRRLSDVGYLIENSAKEACPVDSGILRASIGNELDTNEHKVTIGTNVEYAVAVHEGHGAYQGKPFLKDAAYNNLGRAQAILGGR